MSWYRWAPLLLVLVLVPVAIGFNARLASIRQLRQDESRLKEQVAAEQARQADLKLQQSYVASEAYVEHWARAEARMVKPGEVAVVPVAPSRSQTDVPQPAPAPTPRTILDEWWAVFFDQTPQTAALPHE